MTPKRKMQTDWKNTHNSKEHLHDGCSRENVLVSAQTLVLRCFQTYFKVHHNFILRHSIGMAIFFTTHHNMLLLQKQFFRIWTHSNALTLLVLLFSETYFILFFFLFFFFFFKCEFFLESGRCLSTVSCAHVFFFPGNFFKRYFYIFLLGTISL